MQDAGTAELSPEAYPQKAVYEEAVLVLPSLRMYKLWCLFLQQQMGAAIDKARGRLSSAARQWANHLLAIFARMKAAGELQDMSASP